VIYGAFGFGAAMSAFGLAPSLGFVYPLAVVMGFASMTFMVTSTAIVQMKADPSMRGRVLALQAIVFLGSTPIGGPIVGAICDVWGPRSGLLIGGLSAFVAGAWGIFALRRQAERDQLSSDRPQMSTTSSATVPVGIPAGS
jgi:MFS family permease